MLSGASKRWGYDRGASGGLQKLAARSLSPRIARRFRFTHWHKSSPRRAMEKGELQTAYDEGIRSGRQGFAGTQPD
jgi:hypothetical protein